MARRMIERDGVLNNKFGKDNAEISRELAADRNEYLEMNNLSKHTQKAKKPKQQ